MIRRLTAALLTMLLPCFFAACGNPEGASPIHVITREDGSGTRTAFTELAGLVEDREGQAFDMTTLEAAVTNSTSVVMTSVAGDPNAVGYLSLGSLNDTVKALSVDGAAPTAENIRNGSYPVARDLSVVTGGPLDDAAADFLAFVLSPEGQRIVAAAGYIPVDAGGAYSLTKRTGKVVIAGSSSVTPVMEKLKEAYIRRNRSVVVEIQQSDSTTGVNAVIQGICQIGMTSRDLKESELATGAAATPIARDGIVIAVNKDNPVDRLTLAQVADVFAGRVETWEELRAGGTP